jgi:hypothetical protein
MPDCSHTSSLPWRRHDLLRVAPDVWASALVKGFGCRPVVTYPRALRAGVRKPPRKEPAGGRVGGCRLWGFYGTAAWVGDALAGVVGVGSTIAVPRSSSRQHSTERFWPDRRCKRWLRSRRRDSGAMPEARFPGGQQL